MLRLTTGGRGSAGRGGDDGDAVGSWREAFLRAPYLRDTLIAIGVLSETFETAITWERFPQFHAAVMARTAGPPSSVPVAHGRVTCRFTHVYPDGPAPYYTVLAPGPAADTSSSSGPRSSAPPQTR